MLRRADIPLLYIGYLNEKSLQNKHGFVSNIQTSFVKKKKKKTDNQY